jgi:hypothetical protein
MEGSTQAGLYGGHVGWAIRGEIKTGAGDSASPPIPAIERKLKRSSQARGPEDWQGHVRGPCADSARRLSRNRTVRSVRQEGQGDRRKPDLTEVGKQRARRALVAEFRASDDVQRHRANVEKEHAESRRCAPNLPRGRRRKMSRLTNRRRGRTASIAPSRARSVTTGPASCGLG